MDNSVDIVSYISKSLDSGNYKDALSAPNEDRFKESFRDNCWDLITDVVEKIDDQTLTIKPSLYGACEQLLSIILAKCSPEEALLEYIERIELAKNNAQFGIVLPILQQLLIKLSAKRGRSLEWSVNSISNYIEQIHITEHQLEGDERKLIDGDTNIRRIIKVYSMLPPFYKPFIDEIVAPQAIPKLTTIQIIAAFLISLLGKPMIYIDIDPNVNATSEARQACDTILQDISFRASRKILRPTFVPINNFQRTIRNYSQSISEADVKAPPITGQSDHEEQQYEDNVKSRILESALEFVPKSGWSVESLSSGAKAAGYPTITHGLFPNGGGDLVHYFNIKCNEQLVQEMKTWPKEDLKDGKVPTKFVENAIVTRLLMTEPYKSTWPKAMAIQTLPNNVPNCLATLLSLVDDICYHSGDRSVDFNWYVRRVGLAGIYKTAELFYLTDNSQGNSATRNFVASRIRDAQFVQMALNLNPVTAAPQTWNAAFVTAKNILGINPLK